MNWFSWELLSNEQISQSSQLLSQPAGACAQYQKRIKCWNVRLIFELKKKQELKRFSKSLGQKFSQIFLTVYVIGSPRKLRGRQIIKPVTFTNFVWHFDQRRHIIQNLTAFFLHIQCKNQTDVKKSHWFPLMWTSNW